MTRVAVIGNTHRNLGAACAADLTMGGHEVHYAVYPDQAKHFEAVRRKGGIDLRGEPRYLFWEKTGFARLAGLHDDVVAAVADAEVVLLDVPMPLLEERFAQLAPALRRDAVVHVQSHGYWPAARLMPIVAKAGRADLMLTEATVPTSMAAVEGEVVTAQGRRRGTEFACHPASRREEAHAALMRLFPDAISAPSILQTGLESMNLMVHPAMALLGVSLLENAQRAGTTVPFYDQCNMPSAGRLSDGLDAERMRVCAAYGIRQRPLAAAIDHYYGTSGTGAYEAISNSAVMQGYGWFDPLCWRNWEEIDVPYAVVPLVWLAEKAGVAAPVHRGLAEIFGVLLGTDPWRMGPSMQDFQMTGTRDEIIARFAGA